MTTTDEYIRGTDARPHLRDFEEAEPEDDPLDLSPDEKLWVLLRLRHRNHLRLVRAGALGLGLALALGLSAAWQLDRWLTDWHYDAPAEYTLPEHSVEPMTYRAPGDAA